MISVCMATYNGEKYIATLHEKEIYCLAIRFAYIQECEQKLRMAGK